VSEPSNFHKNSESQILNPKFNLRERNRGASCKD
jgi:hypothetical protein